MTVGGESGIDRLGSSPSILSVMQGCLLNVKTELWCFLVSYI